MALFQSFVESVRERVVDAVGQRMEQAGAQAVSYARDLVPVRTGQLQASISYYWDRSTLTLTLVADKPYGIFVERGTSRMAARPYLLPALAQVGRMFGQVGLEASFPTAPPAFHGTFHAATSGRTHRVTVGNRRRVRFHR